jgi:hypothetical protein
MNTSTETIKSDNITLDRVTYRVEVQTRTDGTIARTYLVPVPSDS